MPLEVKYLGSLFWNRGRAYCDHLSLLGETPAAIPARDVEGDQLGHSFPSFLALRNRKILNILNKGVLA